MNIISIYWGIGDYGFFVFAQKLFPLFDQTYEIYPII